MSELIVERAQRVDTAMGTATGTPTPSQQQDAWRLSLAYRDAAVPTPEIDEAHWAPFVEESDEWTAIAFDASSESWPDA